MTIAAGGIALWINAEAARDEAQRARAEAEDLIEFMLGDLREKLVPVGRLDALEVVGERALDYYEGQDLARLDADSLGRRARALLLVGEIAQQRGDLDEALKAYVAAAATTAEGLERAPDDPQRIFEHAQSVFWVGYVAKEREDLVAAEANFREYLRLAEKLVSLEPGNANWRLELAFATNSLGTVMLEARAFDEARSYFKRSIAIRRELLAASPPDDASAIFDLALAWSWLARAEFEGGAFASAMAALIEELRLYESVLAASPDNRRFQSQWVVAIRMLSRVLLAQGLSDEAYEQILRSRSAVDELISLEPDDTGFISRAAAFYTDLASLERLRSHGDDALAAAAVALRFSQELLSRDASRIEWRTIHGLAAVERLKASGHDEAASDLETFIQEPSASRDENFLSMTAAGWLALGDRASPDEAERAAACWRRGVEALEPVMNRLRASSKLTLATLYLRLGQRTSALSVVSQLESIGYKHPEYMKLKEQLQFIGER
jgi:tetratricopeptide (TPR) repeat protein